MISSTLAGSLLMKHPLAKFLYERKIMMKDIKDYEGRYAITEDGQVWSYLSNKFLKPNMNKDGYLYVNLYKDGKPTSKTIHRLVGQAYIPNLNNQPEINHLDENKTNNSVSNLVWCSRAENVNYGTRNAQVAKKRGKIIYCVELDKFYESAASASRDLNIDASAICKCCKRQFYNTVGGYHWKYKEEE